MPRPCDEAAQHATQLALSRHRAGVSTTPANVWPPFPLFAQRQGPVCRQPARATGWATRTQPGLQPHQPVRTPAFWSNAFRRLPGHGDGRAPHLGGGDAAFPTRCPFPLSRTPAAPALARVAALSHRCRSGLLAHRRFAPTPPPPPQPRPCLPAEPTFSPSCSQDKRSSAQVAEKAEPRIDDADAETLHLLRAYTPGTGHLRSPEPEPADPAAAGAGPLHLTAHSVGSAASSGAQCWDSRVGFSKDWDSSSAASAHGCVGTAELAVASGVPVLSACNQQPAGLLFSLTVLQVGGAPLLPFVATTNTAARPAPPLAAVYRPWVPARIPSPAPGEDFDTWHRKITNNLLAEIDESLAQLAQTASAQQEQQAAHQPPAGGTLVRRKCCCSALQWLLEGPVCDSAGRSPCTMGRGCRVGSRENLQLLLASRCHRFVLPCPCRQSA